MENSYRHQWSVLIILFFTWGFCGLARNSIAFLFPYFSEEFGLTDAHNGYLAATIAFFWAISIITLGEPAGRIGQPKVMVPGMLVGAVALVLFGMSPSILALYALAALIGLGCGSMCAPSLSMIAEQSNPKSRGLFIGVMQSGFTLIGSALGAIVITRLGSHLGWRTCYTIIGILVVLTAGMVFLGLWRLPRKKDPLQPAEKAVTEASVEQKHSIKKILCYHNIPVTTVLTCLSMMWYFTVAAFAILYLMQSRGMDAIVAGAVFAGYGIGGFFGEAVIPGLSDILGRKRTVMICTIAGTLCFAAFVLVDLPKGLLMVSLFFSSMFYSGMMPVLNSVIPSEAVPRALVPTATSFTPAAGELFGGVLSPAIAGFLSGLLGIQMVMNILLVLPIAILGGAFLLEETAPRALIKAKKKQAT